MSAPVVHSLARLVVLDTETLEDLATMPQSAERSRRDIPGQLWKRVAERATVEPRRDARMELGERGPAMLERPDSTLSNGIIRAGERVRA